jgi:hypothetical protein
MTAHRSKELAVKVPRATKRHAGRTAIYGTPLRIRTSGVSMTPAIEKRTRTLLGRRLARFGTFIERVDVRFKDVNGPRGGADTVARIHLSVQGRPPVFVEERALDADRALARAAVTVTRAMDRSVGKRGLRTPAPTRPTPRAVPRPSRKAASRRAPPAKRNSPKLRRRGMVYALETSATKPSRKSTRKSANRLKGASKLSRRTRRRKHSPKARASRAQGQRRRSRGGR